MIKLIFAVLINPQKGFAEILTKNFKTKELIYLILIPIALLAAIISFFRLTYVGIITKNGIVTIPFGFSILYSLTEFILLLLSTLLTCYLLIGIIKALKYVFPKEYIYNIIIFSIIPAFLGELFYFFPKISFVSVILQLYALYLIYVGIKIFLSDLKERITSIFFLSLLILMFIFTIVFNILNSFLENALKVIK